jgi:hypothetical protein
MGPLNMSYSGVSIREAMEKINSISNGWYLPQVQRQYVWGARYESETYICLLLDSLYRRYPIGGLVVWETDQKVPFREFLNDYYPGRFARQVDKGRWTSHKSLVYDGQQRLQTLRSVLYYTFNGRILWFNLLFDKENTESDETGFFFLDRGAPEPQNCIRMTELISTNRKSKKKAKLESKYTTNKGFNADQEILVKANLGDLWDVFVDRNIKSIAYFLVITNSEKEVNEIFRRLNVGGVTLTQLELILGKVKAKYSNYEEELWDLSVEIENASGGFKFTSSEILQFLYLTVFGTIKVEEDRVKSGYIDEFYRCLHESRIGLKEFFENYLWGLLKINHSSIVPRRLAMLPIVVYLTNRKVKGHAFEIKRFSSGNIQSIHQYFILSQFCDWNTQTMINAFAEKAKLAGQEGKDFPLNDIKKIALEKYRSDVLNYHQFVSQPWLALKILTPNRQYIFSDSKPQVDHIFPLHMAGTDGEYKTRVDVLWNFQPMPAGINNFKRARNPKEFFESTEGRKYFGDYDFLPSLDSDQWLDHKKFIRYRHLRMRRALLSKFGLKLKRVKQKMP